MKKYILLLSLSLGFLSCQDFLAENPQGKLSPDTFFSDAKSLPLAVNALYFSFNAGFNESATLAPYMGGDDLTTQPGSNKQAYREFDQFAVANTNDRMGVQWSNNYGTIRAANSILLNMDKNPAEKDVKDKAEGQARFMRAIAYFFLTRIWGNVPIVTTMEPDLTVKRAPIEDIYAVIVDDLTKAETLLPEKWTDGTYQGVRPSQGSAKALLANVYLTMAGWPLKQTDKYAMAAAKAKEVIDKEADYGFVLMEDVADLWKDENNYTNKEIVFGCFFRNNIATWTWQNGNMSAPLPSKPVDEGGWTDYYAEITFFNKFPEGARKDATYQTMINTSQGLVPWDDASTALQHPYFAKMLDAENLGDWWSSRTQQIIRYAEVLLTYAEAKSMSGGLDALARTSVNRVRFRAGLADLDPALSSTDFHDAVIAERGWEFAGGEAASRWFDLVRLEMVEEANADRSDKEIKLINQPEKKYYHMPIPAGEVSLNPNLAEGN